MELIAASSDPVGEFKRLSNREFAFKRQREGAVRCGGKESRTAATFAEGDIVSWFA